MTDYNTLNKPELWSEYDIWSPFYKRHQSQYHATV